MNTFFQNIFQQGMDIARILAETRASKGFNKSEMARQLGVASQLYVQYEKGEVKPKTEFRKKFEELFGISLIEPENNISTGTHTTDISKGSGFGGALTKGDVIRMRKALGDKEAEGVLYVPIPAQAGYAKAYYEEVYIHQLKRYPMPLPYEGERFRVFQVGGHSMEFVNEQTGRPDGLFEGVDVVAEIVDPGDWKKGQIPPYHIYVIVTEDEILIKRILIKPDGTFVMHSDNPDTRPQQRLLRKEDIKELWFVKRKLDWDLSPPGRIDIQI